MEWWKSAVLYQIYPRSFAASGTSGFGDLEGIRRNLDYLSWLGVDGIWLCPFYQSPWTDGGYDVSDYCAVDPLMGDLETFDRLLADAHERDLRVLIDWVPNHTSAEHPWFVEAAAGRDSAKRDWYYFEDQPNNWRAAIRGGSTWEYDERTAQYFLHFFMPSQPDLNWSNSAVRTEMFETLRFWLDRGVDGFRIDSAHCIGKDPRLADDDRCLAGQPIAAFNDQPSTHEILRDARKIVDSYPGDRVLVGEVNIRSTAKVVEYYGSGDELNLTFNFPPMDAAWDPIVWSSVVGEVERRLSNDMAWPVWVLSNHDNSRVRTRYGGSIRRARAAALLLLTLRGTTFIYQGEELGLKDLDLRPSEWHDPDGRDVCRGPIPWQPGAGHGWPTEDTWLPFHREADEQNVATLRQDHESITHLYRELIRARRESPALRIGKWHAISTPPGVLGYRRSTGDDERLVLINFVDETKKIDFSRDWQVQIDTRGKLADEGAFQGQIQPEQALLLCPSR